MLASKKLFIIQFYADILNVKSRDTVEDWFDEHNPMCRPALITHLISANDLRKLIIYCERKNNFQDA